MTPGARVTWDGVEITSQLIPQGSSSTIRGGLTSITITDERGHKADTAEIEIDDREGFKAPAKGSVVQVWMGYEPTPTLMGTYQVERWVKRGPRRVLHISAKAAELTTDIRAARARAWHGKTLGAIAQQIAADQGLTAVVDAELASRVIDHIDQQHESNLHFLSRLAQRNGATFKLADGKIILARHGSSKLPSGAPRPTFDLTPSMVSTWTATSKDRNSFPAVHSHYMDHKAGKRVRVTAGSGKPAHRIRSLYATKNEAARAGRAALHDLARGRGDFETEGEGLPALFADAHVNATGFDPDVDGLYVIRTASHSFQNSGFKTTLTMEIAGPATDAEADPPADPDETIENG